MLKVFYVTDLHGSEICWKKFLNAGAFYSADVVILGGDVTGKAMVPIVRRPNGAWEASLQDHRETLETEAEVVEFEKRFAHRRLQGCEPAHSYPVVELQDACERGLAELLRQVAAVDFVFDDPW